MIGQIIAGVVTAIGVILIVAKDNQKPPLCDSCEHLVSKGKGPWKYECDAKCRFITDSFDKAPEYCAYYKKREKNDE